MGFKDADGGAFGFAGAAEDGIAACGFDGRDDGGGCGVAGDGYELGFQVGGDVVDALIEVLVYVLSEV